MNDFSRPPGALGRLHRDARWLYLSFLLFALAAFATSLALYYDSMGFAPSGAAAWYLGNEDQPDAMTLLLAKSPRELLEVAHFHLYTMPMFLLVLGHLFVLARGGAWKRWVVGAAVLFTALHVAAPFAVWSLGGAWGWVMPATGVPFVASYLVMILWPMPELWRR